jgi:cytochrome c-type biogenesis protein CcmH/NrfG
MKPYSIVLTVAGMCFGVILGWVLASLDVGRTAAPVSAPVSAPQEAPAAGNQNQPAQLDEAQVQALTTILKNDPKNAGAAAQLAETYFKAEHMDDAIKWYREALRLDPKNVDASTQLGMSLFIAQGAGATEPALAQFEHSLQLQPNHPRTLLEKGIVLWRGKNDLAGAAAVWRKLVEVAPDSPEAQAAKQGLQAIDSSRGSGESSSAPSSQ